MKALDVMTGTVISVEPDATVLQAARLMLQQHISGLPVIDKVGRLVGVLSEGDFLRRRETQTERRRSRWLEFLMGPGKIAAEYA
ncbi:MAG: CBS domain-containing protein, partial [Pseudolabrys sp.]